MTRATTSNLRIRHQKHAEPLILLGRGLENP